MTVANQFSLFVSERITDYYSYINFANQNQDNFSARAWYENQLQNSQDEILFSGHCAACEKHVVFYSDLQYGYANTDGSTIVNWRERIECPMCHLNNRMRAAVHFFKSLDPNRNSNIYLTEQTTPMYNWFIQHYPKTIGSEYLGLNLPFGSTDHRGIRNESLTKLTLNNEQFDYILSFDVFEHIPDYLDAFIECLRCLKTGGHLIFTVPFVAHSEQNIVRAYLREGGVEHLLPPEYHGDPLNSDGCLCFYHFAWNLLEELRQIGFNDVTAHFYYSSQFGYLGVNQLIFSAKKY